MLIRMHKVKAMQVIILDDAIEVIFVMYLIASHMHSPLQYFDAMLMRLIMPDNMKTFIN